MDLWLAAKTWVFSPRTGLDFALPHPEALGSNPGSLGPTTRQHFLD